MKWKSRNIFIRFGEIPENEKSTRYFHTIPIKKEKGVSCYNAIKYKKQFLIVVPPIIKDSFCETLSDLYQDYTCGLRKAYLISGKEVGKGADGEPLVNQIKILKELDNLFKIESLSEQELKEQNNLYDIAVTNYIT